MFYVVADKTPWVYPWESINITKASKPLFRGYHATYRDIHRRSLWTQSYLNESAKTGPCYPTLVVLFQKHPTLIMEKINDMASLIGGGNLLKEDSRVNNGYSYYEKEQGSIMQGLPDDLNY